MALFSRPADFYPYANLHFYQLPLFEAIYNTPPLVSTQYSGLL
jgi:hypothetical protein